MGIQIKDNFNKYLTMALAVLLHCSVAAYAVTPEQVLLKSYEKKYSKGNSPECDKIISELQSALKKCEDGYLASRIEYRIGILNFNIGDYKRACKAFNAVAEKGYDYDVLLSALNMKANCARFSGRTKESIDCFQELVQKIEKQRRGLEFENKLIVSSYFSIAQLYSNIGDFVSAIRTYTVFIEKYESVEAMRDFIFKAMEAKARRLFESGDIKRFQAFLNVVIDSNVSGDHKGVIELQRVCMEFILKNGKTKELTSVAIIPSHAVGVVASDSNCDAQDLLNQVAKLNKKHENTKSSAYISYTYASLLDASGNKQDALKAFKDVIEACAKAGVNEQSYFLGEYAKIQSSILSGELNDYNSAINMVNSVGKASSGHLFQISESVKKSLDTLKREVPRNDKTK